ncbi:MAG TPA: PDZ domain-containing protein [Gemmatimonadales bacterium]|nr:PDZ domain-containing protein [Gemmatimonadales bacterium]
MSVRLIVLSTLSAVAVLPAGALAQERQPVTRPRIQIEEQEPQIIRERLRAITQRRARLGVTVDMRASDSDSIGATLSAVTPGGPAAKAGLKSGDIVTRIDGKSLTASDNFKRQMDESLPGVRLVEYASRLSPNDTISVEYRRAGVRHTASLVTGDEMLTLEVFPDGGDFEVKTGRITLERSPFRGMIRGEQLPGGGMSYSLAFGGGPLADLELAPLNPDLGQYFGTTEGVLVINVPSESSLGVKGGDVILGVDGRKATGPNSLLRILRSYDEGDSFKLDIMRNKSRISVTGKLEKRQ